jgi:hypothetical protein
MTSVPIWPLPVGKQTAEGGWSVHESPEVEVRHQTGERSVESRQGFMVHR